MKAYIKDGRIVDMTCDQCHAMPGEHCKQCSMKNEEQEIIDKFSDNIQELIKIEHNMKK